MFSVIALIVCAVVAWVLVDHLLSWRNERLNRGPSAWTGYGAKRFHSTGFEDTQPRPGVASRRS
jgi:hypothetical protein